MQVRSALRAFGNTHPGLLRDTNEDRFHFDATRGIFIVVDGVGGQAAGEKAAEAALAKIRERLEEESGPVEERIRLAITRANDEILRLASLRPEWKGMACVLTVVVLEGPEAVVGHVGDTRLYKIRRGRIEKLTRDHSPVGEREDAGELTEADAMRHPRRNEVYRDVGSEPHAPTDPGFIDVFRVPFEPDAALLLCSDGLTDLVDSGTIRNTVEEYAGHAYEIVRALIQAANDAGGKDNVTVVYVEGSRFAEGEDTGAVASRRVQDATVATHKTAAPQVVTHAIADRAPRRGRAWRVVGIIALIAVVLGWVAWSRWDDLASLWTPVPLVSQAVPATLIVEAGQSIAEAIGRAGAGTEIVVEPGEYRERLQLTSGIRVRSRVPRGAVIRLPGGASEADAAIVARGIGEAEVIGFKIVGDAATPLGTGVFASGTRLTLTDIEIAGARVAAVVFGDGVTGTLLGSHLHDNPGTAVEVRAGAAARIVHSTFDRNAVSERAAGWILVEAGGRAEVSSNTFIGVRPDAVIAPAGGSPSSLAASNWFVSAPTPARTPGRAGRQGRR